jgi:YggT family protein
MGVGPRSLLLYDTASSINRFIDDFIWVYVLLIFAYVLTSWVRLPYSPWLRRIQDFLRDVCEPYLRLFRRLLPSFGPLDLSPVVAIFFLFLLMKVVDTVFSRL